MKLVKEEEIRPKNIFDEYLRLTEQDTKTYFSSVETTNCLCPACSSKGEFAFLKQGFSYEVCDQCETLFVNPRPIVEAFNRYYTESPSSKFWASTFYKETAEARREKLWKPKANLIKNILDKHGKGYAIIDIGGGYGIFAEEMRKLIIDDIIIIEPGPNLAEVCRNKKFTVIQKFLEEVSVEDLPSKNKAFVSFELFEHLHDPSLFLQKLEQLMVSGDLFIFTTLSGTGVDIQSLWENSKSVSPPHHLNFFNPKSVKMLLERNGFALESVTTPGKLDIDIMLNSQQYIKDRFWKTFLKFSSEAERNIWQEFISKSGFSSHMMVVARKN